MKKIPSYQIHNVLNAYTKQLIRTKLLESKDKGMQTERSKITGGKRQAVIEQVSTDIINKIKCFESACEDTDEGKTLSEKCIETRFVYHTIDENNKKIIHTVTVKEVRI